MKEQPLKLYKENTINNNDNNVSYFQTDQNNQKKFSSSLINNPTSTNLKNNNNNNLSISINSSNKNIFNKAAKEEFSQKINDIQINLEKNLIENTTNSKSKKYNTIKHAFEDLLVLLQNKKPNHTLNNLLQKLLIG
jgi:nitrogen fixation/metabolism regulation signal transduction histidine kinase